MLRLETTNDSFITDGTASAGSVAAAHQSLAAAAYCCQVTAVSAAAAVAVAEVQL